MLLWPMTSSPPAVYDPMAMKALQDSFTCGSGLASRMRASSWGHQ